MREKGNSPADLLPQNILSPAYHFIAIYCYFSRMLVYWYRYRITAKNRIVRSLFMSKRIVPEIPDVSKRIRIIIDSDAANEIDDLYAITMAISHPERFDIVGFIATHYAQWAGPDSTKISYNLLLELLENAGKAGAYPVKMGSHPMQYANTYNDSEGVDFIIENARASSPEDPLWVIAIGAATNLACALLKAPDIIPNVRYIFHARSEETWPERSKQFNVYGDIIAAKSLLESEVPLIWFDTGTHLYAHYDTTREKLAPINKLGKYLHDYRDRNPYFALPDKGFFDMADFAYLIDPPACQWEIIDAPEMNRFMYFDHNHKHGQMLRVYDVDVEKTWEIFYRGIERLS